MAPTLVHQQPGGNVADPLKTQIVMNDGTTKGLLGFMLGAAIGATMGILLAPASGKDTRKKLARKIREKRDDLDEVIEQGRAEWNKTKGRAADAASMTKDEVSDFVRFLFEEGRDLRDRLKNDVERTADDVADKARKAADNVRHSAN